MLEKYKPLVPSLNLAVEYINYHEKLEQAADDLYNAVIIQDDTKRAKAAAMEYIKVKLKEQGHG